MPAAVTRPGPWLVTLRGGRRPRPWALWLIALSGSALAAGIVISGTSRDPVPVSVARAATIAVPVVVGLHGRSRYRDRFGLLLVALGIGCLFTTLAESSDEALYTAGRIAGWCFEVLFVYVVLAFPTGRLEARADRVLAAALAVVVAVLYLPRAFLASSFEVPSPFTSCTSRCPGNSLFALDAEPGFVDSVMRPLGAALVFAIMIAVTARLLLRLRAETPLERRFSAPVVAIAVLVALGIGGGLVARELEPAARVLPVVAWMLAAAAPALAVATLAVDVRWRLLAGRALERLAASLGRVSDGRTLQRAFSDALEDPDFEIAFHAGDASELWLDCLGDPRAEPVPSPRRGVTTVYEGSAVVAALVHDPALRHEPDLLEAGVAIAGAAIERTRLAAHAEAATAELQRSRARIAASAERERRRIERDLHDGAQQRLVALRIEMDLTEELVHRSPDEAAARMQQLAAELDIALEEIRSLAHGMYPPLLADRGLSDALRAIARGSAVPVDVEAHEVRRYAPEVESAVYFCVRESLQNALKHAPRARRIVVRVDGGGGELRFSVHDDGAGAPGGELRPGVGITNMQDRLAAVGGELAFRSTPGVGTVVRGRVRSPGSPSGPDVPAG